MSDRVVQPYPEAIRRPDLAKPGAWTVEHNPTGGGYVILDNRAMSVPILDYPCATCGENHTQAIRAHEMGHVAWTPNKPPRGYGARVKRLPDNLMQGCEDTRLCNRIVAAGIELPAVTCPDDITTALDAARHKRDAQRVIELMAAACASPATAKRVMAWAIEQSGVGERHIRTAASQLRYLMDDYHPMFRDTVETAERLHALAQSYAADYAREDAERLEKAKNKIERGGGKVPTPSTGDGLTWGEATLETAPLTRPARNTPQKKYAARDEGCIPVAMHRVATDGRIFRQPSHRRKPLTLLVDCSGSMSWAAEDLRALLDKSPASTIALYSGSGHRGIIRIVARNGRRADDRFIHPPYGGNNLIDGPALDWLGKQRGDRVWLSDGYVTAPRGGTLTNADAARRVIAGKIMRVPDADTAIAVASGKIKHTPSTRHNAVHLPV